MDIDRELIEEEFLSILVLEPKIGFDLLQIKPKYLKDKVKQEIFAAILDLKSKNLAVDYASICKMKPNLIDNIAEIVASEYVPILDIRKQFMTCQIMILDEYKKKVINDLSVKLNNGQLTCDDYLSKMQKINDVNIKDEIKELTKEEILENISTANTAIELKKFKKLSETLKLVQGDFLIIGASTGTGKSGLLLNFLNDLMDRYQCIYFNMEMSKSTIYRRLISINCNVPLKYIDSPTTGYQKGLIDNAIDTIAANKVIIEHKASYLHEIKAVLSQNKQDNKHTIIFLDHIGLIKKLGNKNIYEQTTDVAKQLRQFCLDYDCTIIAAAQLNRTSYTSDVLDLSMLKDSGELENSSSKVILLYKNKNKESKDEFVTNMVLDIAKNRDGILGKINSSYDKSKQIFTEVLL